MFLKLYLYATLFFYLQIVKVCFHVVSSTVGSALPNTCNFGQRLPIRTILHSFLERHPVDNKNLYYVCPASLMDLEYSFNWPRNNEKVIRLWRHLVVLNSETADGKSSALTTGPLIHNHDDAILATHYFLDLLNWQNFIYVK